MPIYSEYMNDRPLNIPHVVKHADLLAALEPICNLLGVRPQHLYDETGLIITAESIRFTVPARREDADKRSTPSHAGCGEWVRDIEVLTDLGVANRQASA